MIVQYNQFRVIPISEPNMQDFNFAVDEAYQYLIEWSTDIVNERRAASNYECDIYLFEVVNEYLKTSKIPEGEKSTFRKKIAGVFMSAAWELALKGVLRVGSTDDIQGSNHRLSTGSSFAITERGKAWLKQEKYQPISMSSSAMVGVMRKLQGRFGESFYERATEASACYENGCYLACCAMCGAAIESIFLKTAVEKLGDEKMF